MVESCFTKEMSAVQRKGERFPLWAQNAHITDARHTPQQPEDDQSWHGADVIRHRYTSIIFPSAPDTAQPANLLITIDGNHANVRSTTQIGQEASLAGDQWQIIRENGCWLLQRLTFNLEES